MGTYDFARRILKGFFGIKDVPTKPVHVLVNPRLLVVDPGATLSERDRPVVHDDFRRYVELTRAWPDTPRIKAEGGKLIAVSGIAYIRAAVDASPAFEEIVCEIATTSDQIRRLGLREPSREELRTLAHWPPAPDGVCESPQLLSFFEPLTQAQVEKVEARLFGCSEELRRLGDRLGIDRISWLDENVRTQFMLRHFEDAHRPSDFFVLLDALRDIDGSAARIRSWNGRKLSLWEAWL
jgi:hypothetical protein